MQYGGVYGDDGEGAAPRTAFREAEKKYQLFRERIMKMKRGKKKPGKMITRPIDMSDVLDLHDGQSDSLPPGVVRHDVQGYRGPVYTFTRHPGLVFLPGALPGPQQAQLTAAALADYPEPPARTNLERHYGPLPGLWSAAQRGLRLNWGRRDEPAGAGPSPSGQACGRPPTVPRPCQDVNAACEEAGTSGAEPAAAAAAAAAAASPAPAPAPHPCEDRDPDPGATAASASREVGGPGGWGSSLGREDNGPSQADSEQVQERGQAGREQGQGQEQGQPRCSGQRAAEETQAPCGGGGEADLGDVRSARERQRQQGHAAPERATPRKQAEPTLVTSTQAGSCGACGTGQVMNGCGGPADAAAAVDAAEVTAEPRCRPGAGAVADGDRGRGCCSDRSSSSSGGDGCAGGQRSHRSSGSGSECVEGAVEGAPSFEECWSADGPGPPAEQLLRRLRWATLGPQFEWTQRRYDFAAAFRTLPPTLDSLARQLAAVVDSLQGAGLQVLPANAAAGGGYTPDAAIVNYYQQGDVLGGHLDDVERDMSQPIVSVSLGCPAIFLMGGPTKQVPPSAMLLRGGDVMLLAGEARRCYHGVPRILEAQPHGAGVSSGAAEGKREGEGEGDPTESYTRCARINISIRAAA